MRDLISRQAAIDALDEIEAEVAEGFGFEYEKWRKYFCDLPSAQPSLVKEEDILKFYYVESLDDYWIGRRVDNFYYATWDRDLQNFVWSKSRYLPWGEHVVAPDTLWKEHTYPSEPKEIPFVDWLKGFYTKYFAADNQQPPAQPEREKGKWIVNETLINCSVCKHSAWSRHAFEDIVRSFNFCPNCGKPMKRGEQDEH